MTTPTIVSGLAHSGGLHCETTTLGVLLPAVGIDLSEPLLFGLGGGLSFIWWDSRRQELPFLGGRVKPFVLTRNLAARLGLDLRVQQTTSATKAWENVRDHLDRGRPVGLQLDSYDLDYFTSRVHFAGHIVALYGYDDDTAYLVDTAQQGGGVTTSRSSLARARAARGPMSAPHRSFTIERGAFSPGPDAVASAAWAAIAACANEFLSPPIAHLGHRGIRTAAARVGSLLTRVSDPERGLPAIALIMEKAGTGGALFRTLYRDFLTEVEALLPRGGTARTVATSRDRFADAARRWTEVASLIETAGRTGAAHHLAAASVLLEEIADIETAAMTDLRTLAAAQG